MGCGPLKERNSSKWSPMVGMIKFKVHSKYIVWLEKSLEYIGVLSQYQRSDIAHVLKVNQNQRFQ